MSANRNLPFWVPVHQNVGILFYCVLCEGKPQLRHVPAAKKNDKQVIKDIKL